MFEVELLNIVEKMRHVGSPEKIILFGSPEEIDEWKSVPNAFITTILREGKVLYEA